MMTLTGLCGVGQASPEKVDFHPSGTPRMTRRDLPQATRMRAYTNSPACNGRNGRTRVARRLIRLCRGRGRPGAWDEFGRSPEARPERHPAWRR